VSEPHPVTIDGDGAPHLTVTRRTLPCGLDVVVHADPAAPQVCTSVWYRVGSSDEPAELTGLAHLFEHLFKNSLHMPAHHYDVLRRAGATDANASTGADRTAYVEVVPANQLALALWLESDRMGYVLPGLDGERLAIQQSVVRAERRQRYETVPYGFERFAIAMALYPEGHPHRHLTIGLHDHIQAATVDDVRAFYRAWYVPANATLVVSGDVDPARIDDDIDHYFATFPASTRPVRPVPPQPRLGEPAYVRTEDRFAALTRVHRAWHTPAAFAGGDAELEVLAAAWCAVGTGALWRRLVYETQLAQRVSAWTQSYRLGGELHITVDLRSGADPARVRDILDDVCARGIDAPAVERIRVRREANQIWMLTSLSRRAALVQRYMLYTGEPNGFAAELARFRAVTVESVERERAAWLRPEGMVEVETVPA
jgi:predicted Zn-dependent peptidase